MKLIIINGPTGVGKSTIAKEVHKKLPLSFLLEVDAQRRYISGYKDFREESGELMFDISKAVTEECLRHGRDVVVDKIIIDSEITLNKFIEIGKKYNAEVFEFILNSDRELWLNRINERGYRENGSLTPEKAEWFWDKIQEYIKKRPEAVVVDTSNKTVEETLGELWKKINSKN